MAEIIAKEKEREEIPTIHLFVKKQTQFYIRSNVTVTITKVRLLKRAE
ncbi:MAG: hypothetical protein ACTSXO_09995 [Candidatus Heimdallarchaeota archaeon]